MNSTKLRLQYPNEQYKMTFKISQRKIKNYLFITKLLSSAALVNKPKLSTQVSFTIYLYQELHKNSKLVS